MKKKIDQEILNRMSKNPGNWNGPFYLNQKDPRLIVPKQVPALGWTFNFASPLAYLTLFIVALIVIASDYYLL